MTTSPTPRISPKSAHYQLPIVVRRIAIEIIYEASVVANICMYTYIYIYTYICICIYIYT